MVREYLNNLNKLTVLLDNSENIQRMVEEIHRESAKVETEDE